MKGMAVMTSKERVRAALSHQPPDRVPSTMQCVDTAWEKLRNHFGMQTNDEVMDFLEIDTRIMDIPPYIGPPKPAYKNEKGEMVHTHPFGYEYIEKWNGAEYNWHIISMPYNKIRTMDDFERFEGWVDPDMYDYGAVADFCSRYPDKAIRIGWPGPYQVFTLMYDQEEFYIKMLEDPELIKAMLDLYCDASLEMYERMFNASGDHIDILRCCDDYGTQRGMLFSPAMWDDFFAKNTRRFVELAHRHHCYYMQHSCGAIRGIIPNLINCGVDAIEPLQKVTGMEVDALKRDFGDKLAFQGGVDTQGVLPLGTPEEVRAETERIIRALHQDGGYILAPSQDFEGDVPVENILALYEARKSFQ